MTSMTGYAYKEALVDTTHISIEIKSVNSRFLDINISMPPYLNLLESKIKKYISSFVQRGKVDLTIRIKETQGNTTVSADIETVKAYYEVFSNICTAIGYSEADIPLGLITEQEGVLNITHEYDAEAYWKKIEPLLVGIVKDFAEERRREGENLKKDILLKLAILDNCASFFTKWQPEMEERFKTIITNKFTELLGQQVDENRIMQEVASLLVKYTINEEVIRLHSHLEAMRSEIENNETPGKRLDFFCQEANREINTIGSKNQFAEVSSVVVDAKDALENIREQSKNIE